MSRSVDFPVTVSVLYFLPTDISLDHRPQPSTPSLKRPIIRGLAVNTHCCAMRVLGSSLKDSTIRHFCLLHWLFIYVLFLGK